MWNLVYVNIQNFIGRVYIKLEFRTSQLSVWGTEGIQNKDFN